MPKLFISYRREDSEHITGRIYDHLEPHFGRNNVFLDIDTIPFGVDFREYLDQAVGLCDLLLAIIGEQWLNVRFREGPRQGQRRLDDPGDFVRIEIQSALARGIPVIPVLVGRAAMPGEQELPDGLKRLAYRNAAEVRSGRDFREHVERLVRGIQYLLRQEDQEKLPRPGDLTAMPLGKGIEMKFAWIPPGTFLMGSPPSEPERDDDETQHRVTLTKGFWLEVFPVTRGQFARFVKVSGYRTEAERDGGAHFWTGKEWQKDPNKNWQTPGFAQTDDHPVVCVSWNDTVAFCEWLTQQDSAGQRYRLPSEAEWEYAGRAGTTTPFYFGSTISTKQANYDGNSVYAGGSKGEYRQQTTAVGSFPANRWGLYDMHGNVLEWCQDWYGSYPKGDITDPQDPQSGETRVLRGGSWYGTPRNCRAAYRCWLAPGHRSTLIGFRVVLCLD